MSDCLKHIYILINWQVRTFRAGRACLPHFPFFKLEPITFFLMEQQQDLTGVLLQAASIVEAEVDKRLEELKDIDDMQALRAQRMAILKKQHENRAKWLAAGHGKVFFLFQKKFLFLFLFFSQLNEISTEKEFFAQTKEAEKGIVHFHKPENKYSDELSQHLRKLAEHHIEVKFMIINAEKSPFLVDRLGIRFVTSCLVICIVGHY